MLLANGTGVSTYSRALHAALVGLTEQPMTLGADPPHPSGRLVRWARAAAHPALTLRLDVEADGRTPALLGQDIFRTAQVRFDMTGRLTRLRPPVETGIMHWTYPVPLRMAGWINIYTVHDAIPLIRPDLSPIGPRRHRRMLRRIAEHASHIVTVSEAARTEICDAMEWSKDFVTNCSQPADIHGAPQSVFPGLHTKRYLLVCGSIEPRKNIARIIRAFHAAALDIPLVLVGPNGWRADEELRPSGAMDNVIRLGTCNRDVLLWLIANARALVMPSLAEGFGLPVAEAMMLGTPVLCSNIPALAETAGDAACLFDPMDVTAMTQAMARIAQDDGLAALLSAAGIRRAARFSVEAFATRLDSVYATAIASFRSNAYQAGRQHRGEIDKV
jgi:glycosyltransferase involved in cell wall biosynthesis